jgi:hypothetical protein
MICIIAARLNLILWHCDIVTAFLNADLPPEIEMYIKFSHGILVDDCEYALLKKSIYGLKQAPREWNKMSHSILVDNFQGLTQSSKDPAFYFLVSPTLTVFLTVHVDDYFIACDPPTWYQSVFLPTLRRHINVVDLGQASSVLGMVVSQSDHCVVLSQEHVISDIEERYGLKDSRPVYTPMDPKFNPLPAKESDPVLPFRNLLGELLWVARCTRPDILFAVNKLSRYNNGYSDVHWQALLRIAKYLCTTKSQKLHFRPSTNTGYTLTCYVDADWAGCAETRRSTTGYILYLCGAPLAFHSKRQKIVTLSSTEAEVYALSAATSEIEAIVQMISEFEKVDLPVIVHEDNKGAIALSENQLYNTKSKHIPLKEFRVRELVENGDIKISYVSSSENIADLFTKPLADKKFSTFAKSILQGLSD